MQSARTDRLARCEATYSVKCKTSNWPRHDQSQMPGYDDLEYKITVKKFSFSNYVKLKCKAQCLKSFSNYFLNMYVYSVVRRYSVAIVFNGPTSGSFWFIFVLFNNNCMEKLSTSVVVELGSSD